MRHFSIRDEYKPRFGRQVLTIWSGLFSSDFEGDAIELPGHNGFMIAIDDRPKIRVLCPSPRTEANYLEVDEAIHAAIADHFTPRHDDFQAGGHHGQGPEYSEEPAVLDGAF